MEYSSILNLREAGRKQTTEVYYTDLNLDQIIRKISQIWGEDVGALYEYLPADRDCEDFRREVCRDLFQPAVRELLERFLDRMQEGKKLSERRGRMQEERQQNALQLWEIKNYCDALSELAKKMSDIQENPEDQKTTDSQEYTEIQTISSAGMKNFQAYLNDYLKSDAYQTMMQEAEKLQGELKAFRVRFSYHGDSVTVEEAKHSEEYEKFLEECFPDHGKHLKNPFLYTEDITALESETLRIFQKKNRDFFKELKAFGKKYQDYMAKGILQFQEDLVFYLAFFRFADVMKEKGFVFSFPEVGEKIHFGATGLYDLALACVCMEEEREVVQNDMDYWEGEQFFVLTGPNQGGKTTFARSLGQLVFFTKMGLPVPAFSAKVPYFETILTHFSVEESAETGKGKLMEELTRLVPMMEENRRNAFVVINELFTTAANYDACIMGKKVLEHFTGMDCMGIYVTHLQELGKNQASVVALRAQINEQKKQTFKVGRGEALELAGACEQVKKYGLTYQQIKERFE